MGWDATLCRFISIYAFIAAGAEWFDLLTSVPNASFIVAVWACIASGACWGIADQIDLDAQDIH